MNRNIFTGIIILIIVLVAFFVKPTDATEHEWVPNDIIWVNHICSSSEILKRTAIEYQKGTEEGIQSAEQMWTFAIATGVCVTSPQNFMIKLVTRIDQYPDLYGAIGYDGELWSAYTVAPDGKTLLIYAGVVSKEFAAKPILHNNI